MEFVEISKQFGPTVVFDRFSLSIPEGTILAVVGHSGMGKTTLLQMASGLLEPDRGTVVKGPTEQGAVSYLFQEPRLLPQSTVFANVELALHKAYPRREERYAVAKDYLGMVGLEGSLGAYPDQLSGGMRQRVAIARCFAHPASLLLMDEPFQSLDIKLRYDLLDSFLSLWEQHPRTTIFVTHDPMEAVLVGDRVCCLGSPEKPKELYEIDIPRKARNISDPTLLKYESRLVRALVND